jgi:hypothetical protein
MAWRFTSEVIRRPKVFTLNYTSTLSASLLNEARFGYRANQHVIWAPWEVTDEKLRGSEVSVAIRRKRIPDRLRAGRSRRHEHQQLQLPNQLRSTGQQDPALRLRRHSGWTHGKHAFKGGRCSFHIHAGSETPTPTIARATGGGQASLPATAFASDELHRSRFQ